MEGQAQSARAMRYITGIRTNDVFPTSMRRLHPDLPIFRLNAGGEHVLYAPGHVALVSASEAQKIEATLAARVPQHSPAAQELWHAAQTALATWRHSTEAPFRPKCLTVYLSNQCNMACPYCFANSGSTGRDRVGAMPTRHTTVISEEAVRAAARLVARCCSENGEPFRLVLHGGGEPTVHWALLQRLVHLTRQVAAESSVDWWAYLATNGALPEHHAQWVATHFNLVGLSCDGPPDIQNRQRPLADGGRSSHLVERTARILAENGMPFAVRTTITPGTVERQEEILVYVHQRLGPVEIRFEPVYRVRGAGPEALAASQAESFVTHFLAAQRRAAELGCTLSYSGVRLDEVHGSYCNVLRDVLHLMPDGTASSCFFCVDGRDPATVPFVIGRFDQLNDRFVLNEERIAKLKRRAAAIADRCRECVNVLHCARECPESCMGIGELGDRPGFRCLVNRKLAEAWIVQAADLACQDEVAKPSVWRRGAADEEADSIEAELAPAPASVDRDAIRAQYEAVRGLTPLDRRALPAPVWARRGYEHDGTEAWQVLSCDFSDRKQTAPNSVYVHVPFCDRRCGFCDCYSFPLLARHRQKEYDYTRALLAEIDAWSRIEPVGSSPVTTIHFGGGTPNHLSPHTVERIMDRLRSRLGVTPSTEWALESTVSLITEEHLNWLLALGFTRLHVGVQTLEEPLRQQIGRRESAETVVERLRRAVEMGLVVSVDLIYGFPGDTLTGFVEGLERIVAAGVHGFSLYQLQVTSRNRRFVERLGDVTRSPAHDYVLFQAGSQILHHLGYSKNHFSHFARPEDTNLYYTHAQRGEDLLGLGPTADGVFGGYHYRHPEYLDYTAPSETGAPALEGGVWESTSERKAKPASAALMVGSIAPALLSELKADSLLSRWLERGLLQESSKPGIYDLTANGSWFVTDMIEQLLNAVAGRL